MVKIIESNRACSIKKAHEKEQPEYIEKLQTKHNS
jgi:hypothetical protein